MNPVVTNSIIVAALSGLLSGVVVTCLTYLLSKKRTKAEIGNFEAQAAKAKAETDKILAELKTVSATVSYTLAGASEDILIGGKAGLTGFDFRGAEGQFWEGIGKDTKAISPKGEGTFRFENGVLNIQRTNAVGRYELIAQKYDYKGSERTLIPKDDSISGLRRIRASFEAKTVGGDHSLRFLIREPASGRRFGQQVVRVTGNTWTSYEVFLSAEANVDSQFRIDDEDVSQVPSSVQIRNLVVAQRN